MNQHKRAPRKPGRVLSEAKSAPSVHASTESADVRKADRDPAVRLQHPMDVPTYPSLLELFLKVSAEMPGHIAVIKGRSRWTYEELCHRAMGIAGALSGMDDGQAPVVAVHGRRSFALVASALGVLIAGRVLLLLDSHLPADRKRIMLQEADAHVILQTSKDSASQRVEMGSGAHVVCIDPEGRVTSAEHECSSVSFVAPHLLRPSIAQLAYICFTSGTTGKPKAVLGTHVGLGHFINWQRTEFGIRHDDRVSQLTSPSFDVVLRELFLPLTSGAVLCLPEDSLRLMSADTLLWIVDQHITVSHLVPTLAEAWLAPSGQELERPDLRLAFFAGEPLTSTLIHRWRRRFGSNVQIVNLYGPTETTLAKFFYRVPADPIRGVQPLGQPLPNCEAYIAKPSGHFGGVGQEGEIVIRTPFRTRGYLHSDRDQGARFVRNPFRKDPEDLLYFTGDRGLIREDGLLEIRGRLDNQVKISGVRVEPGEVAVVLSENPGVRACAVVAVDAWRKPQSKILVAYWVPAPDTQVTGEQLKEYLRQRLPKEMVPLHVVAVGELPVTRNGKLDLQELQRWIPHKSSPGRGVQNRS